MITKWQWTPDIQAGYIVSDIYHILTTQTEPTDVGLLDFVLHKQVPLKMSIFAWRFLRGRLPTKNNLVRRGLLSAEEAGCVAGCGHDESMSHLFIHCESYGALWRHIRSWIGVSGVEPYDISEHLFRFIHLT